MMRLKMKTMVKNIWGMGWYGSWGGARTQRRAGGWISTGISKGNEEEQGRYEEDEGMVKRMIEFI